MSVPSPGTVSPVFLALEDQLDADRFSGFHDVGAFGWLAFPASAPERPEVQRARAILAMVREALDM